MSLADKQVAGGSIGRREDRVAGSHRSSLPYDMGNAGDLLKHGVLAEFIRWRVKRDAPVRFLDLFAGEPFACVASETIRRVRGLAGSALTEAQTGIDECRYFGSGKLVHNLGKRLDADVPVFVGDCNPERCKRLLTYDLRSLKDKFPDAFDCFGRYDAYAAFDKIVCKARKEDVALIDPFKEFLPRKAKTIVPQMEEMADRAAVVLFALNKDPGNRVASRFDDLLKTHLRDAWRMTCPPLPYRGIRGESQYHAEVVLAARDLRGDCPDTDGLKARLEDHAWKLAKVLCLCDDGARMLLPRVIGEGGGAYAP